MDLLSQTAKPTKYVTTTCLRETAAPTRVPFEKEEEEPPPAHPPAAQQGCDSKFRGQCACRSSLCVERKGGKWGERETGEGVGMEASLFPLTELSDSGQQRCL